MSKASSSQVPFLQMTISAPKETSVEDTDDKALPPNLRKRPSLKKPVESENLSKNRNSYQLPSNVAVSQKIPKEVAEKKSSRTKRLSQVKTPEGLKVKKKKKKKKTKKQCGVDEVEETAEVGQKVKRLSEVKTPEALKKKTNKK